LNQIFVVVVVNLIIQTRFKKDSLALLASRGWTISNCLIQNLNFLGLSFDNLVAQCYDGAAVMSGKHNSVQKKIKSLAPDSMYIQCSAHVLNLALIDSVYANVGDKNFFKSKRTLATFFQASPKRYTYLETEIKKSNENNDTKTKKNKTCYSCFYPMVKSHGCCAVRAQQILI
jgi:hypothetical protein